jgi:hypothetical protein
MCLLGLVGVCGGLLMMHEPPLHCRIDACMGTLTPSPCMRRRCWAGRAFWKSRGSCRRGLTWRESWRCSESQLACFVGGDATLHAVDELRQMQVYMIRVTNTHTTITTAQVALVRPRPDRARPPAAGRGRLGSDGGGCRAAAAGGCQQRHRARPAGCVLGACWAYLYLASHYNPKKAHQIPSNAHNTNDHLPSLHARCSAPRFAEGGQHEGSCPPARRAGGGGRQRGAQKCEAGLRDGERRLVVRLQKHRATWRCVKPTQTQMFDRSTDAHAPSHRRTRLRGWSPQNQKCSRPPWPWRSGRPPWRRTTPIT